MKKNISLLLGIIIGALAASSLVQSYSSEYTEILNIFPVPIHIKHEGRKRPSHKDGIELYLPEVQPSDVGGPIREKLHIKCL